MPKTSPLVAVIMGSSSDWETMSVCVKTLDQLGIANQAQVLSAHRTPDATAKFAREAADRGIRVMIAAAGGADRTCAWLDRKSTRLNSSHGSISYAVFCL